jgi:hypothetical protein
MADQQQTQPVLGIHLIVGQQPEILEDVGPEMVGFIDDQDGAAARVGAQAGDLGLDLAIERGAGAFDAEAHLPGDGLVEVHDVAGGERHVDDAVEAGVELREDFATGAGLAAAAVAGDQPDAAQVEEVREADLELATGGRGKQIVGAISGPKGCCVRAKCLRYMIRNPRRACAAGGPAAARWPALGREVLRGVVAAHEAVGVGIDGFGGPTGGRPGRRPGRRACARRVVAQRDRLADERRVDLVDDAVEADGAVLLDLAFLLEEEESVRSLVGS